MTRGENAAGGGRSFASCSSAAMKLFVAVLMNAVVRARPAAAKGQYLRKVAVSSTMGPSVHIDPSDAQALGESL